MNARPASIHRLTPRHELPEPAQGSGVQARLQDMLARQVPRLADAASALRQEVASSAGATLGAMLQAHLAALAALRFELLVSPGLRAGPRERDEAAFRRQVSAVSQSTESTWLAIKRFMEERSAGNGTEALAADFSIELRAVQRRVAEEGRMAETLQEHLAARAGVTQAPAAVKAIDDLRTRNGNVRSVLERLQALCETARPAQGAAYALAEAQAVLRGSLKQLAVRLSGSLLECLRVLVSGDVGAPAAELRNAQQARADIQDALSQALADLLRVQSCAEDVTVWLDAVGHRFAALPVDPRPVPRA